MTILDDPIEEAHRIVQAAAAQGLTMRLLGGLAIRAHSPSANHRALARSYPDLDYVYAGRASYKIEALMPSLGYSPNKSFNLFNGNHRLLFFDDTHQRQVDIFVGEFKMCHSIPMSDRLAKETLTIPLAELLLTKMQIVQMNEKDIRDLCALLLDHPFGAGDDEAFNLAHIAKLCAADWGLWKTITLSAQKVCDFCDAYQIEAESKLTIIERLTVLRAALDSEPKSLKWKARDAIGERVQWYDLPEEVKRG